MCYKIIQYCEYNCGHLAIVRQQIVDCNEKKCSFSSMHDREAHDCAATCAQRLLADQAIIMDTLEVPCSRCGGRTNGNH
ncbi:hypothetical protein BU15DRAFT_42413 [Melanogaster broomeanus]|nr:hypothetical protein BU15DRAFT_42413 [Melanogaster broomeanus]